MHPTAITNAQNFFDTYGDALAHMGDKIRVIEIGSQDVNGSLRATCPDGFEYVGVDFVAGKGVDVILDDPYSLPFESGSADVVISSSCFEHAEMFWLLYLEVLRILKPTGLFYLNVPSNGDFHRWPVDCWRFYPDSGNALVAWAKRNSINACLLESYTSVQSNTGSRNDDQWNDFVAVFLKDETLAPRFLRRILDTKSDISNGLKYGSPEFINRSEMPEDKKKLFVISQIISNQIKIA